MTNLVTSFSSMQVAEVPFTLWLKGPSGQNRVFREIQANPSLVEHFLEWIKSNIQYGKDNGPFLFKVCRILRKEQNNAIMRFSAVVMEQEFAQFLDYTIPGNQKRDAVKAHAFLCDLLKKNSILAFNMLNSWGESFNNYVVDLNFTKTPFCPLYQAMCSRNIFALELIWSHLSEDEKKRIFRLNDFFFDLREIKERKIQEIFFAKEEVDQRFSMLTTNPLIYNYPLHHAAFIGNTVMIEVLLAGMSRGQRIQCITVNLNGHTPVSVSLLQNHTQATKVLGRFLTRQQKEALLIEKSESFHFDEKEESFRVSLLRLLYQKRSH